MRRVENEPACVHLRKGRSEWCVLSLCAEQGPWGCFNILLNVVFLLTLTGEIFSPDRLLPTRLLTKFLGLLQEKGSVPSPDPPPQHTHNMGCFRQLGDRACVQGWAPHKGTLPRTAPASRADRELWLAKKRSPRRETALRQAPGELPHLCSPNNFVGRHVPSFIDGHLMP